MLGDFDYEQFYYFPDTHTVRVLVAVYLFMVLIIILNLLIAVMGDSHARVSNKSSAYAVWARVEVLIEIELLAFGPKKKSSPQLRNQWGWIRRIFWLFLMPTFGKNEAYFKHCHPKWLHVVREIDYWEKDNTEGNTEVLKHVQQQLNEVLLSLMNMKNARKVRVPGASL